jgi:hypothetical protein
VSTVIDGTTAGKQSSQTKARKAAFQRAKAEARRRSDDLKRAMRQGGYRQLFEEVGEFPDGRGARPTGEGQYVDYLSRAVPGVRLRVSLAWWVVNCCFEKGATTPAMTFYAQARGISEREAESYWADRMGLPRPHDAFAEEFAKVRGEARGPNTATPQGRPVAPAPRPNRTARKKVGGKVKSDWSRWYSYRRVCWRPCDSRALARAMGLAGFEDVLDRLRPGRLGNDHGFPVRGGAGNITCFQYRFRHPERIKLEGTNKKFEEGGNPAHGLIFDPQAGQAAAVVSPEGARDTIVSMILGMLSAGRTMNCCGDIVEAMTRWLRLRPHVRTLLVPVDNDLKPDGRWPGRDGSLRYARGVLAGWDGEAYLVPTPDGFKDLFEWFEAKWVPPDDEEGLKAARQELSDLWEERAERVEPAPAAQGQPQGAGQFEPAADADDGPPPDRVEVEAGWAPPCSREALPERCRPYYRDECTQRIERKVIGYFSKKGEGRVITDPDCGRTTEPHCGYVRLLRHVVHARLVMAGVRVNLGRQKKGRKKKVVWTKEVWDFPAGRFSEGPPTVYVVRAPFPQQDFNDPDKRVWEWASARQKKMFCWVRLDRETVLAFGWAPWGLPGERAMTLEEACAEYEAAAFPADGELPRSLQYRFGYGRLWQIPPEKAPPTGWLIGTAERSLADMALLLDIHSIKHSDCDRAVFFDPPGDDKEQELLRDANPEREFWRHHELGPRPVAYRLHPETGPPPLEMEVRADRFARTARRAGVTARWVTRHVGPAP